MKHIPLAECEKGVIYKLHSRNLHSGVFDGKEGFIGVREKFWSRFLDTEYHGETGPPHGTAWPLERVGEVPDHPSIPLQVRVSFGEGGSIENANLFALLQYHTPGLALRLMTAEEWEEFFRRLEGPEGCNFRVEYLKTVWDCKGGMDKTFSEKILDLMELSNMKLQGVLTYVEEFGGHCDCEVLFNAADRIREEIERESGNPEGGGIAA